MNEPDDDILRRFQEKYDEARDALGRDPIDRDSIDRNARNPLEKRADRDPRPLRRLAEHVSDMQGALRKISTGAVSREALTEVVRESVEDILEQKSADVAQALNQLARSVESSTAQSERSVRELRDEMRVALGTLRSDTGRKSDSLSRSALDAVRSELARITAEVRLLPSKLGVRQELQEIKARLAGLQKQVDRKPAAPGPAENAPPPSGERDAMVLLLDQLERRLSRVEASIDSRNGIGPDGDPRVSSGRLESSVSQLLLLEVLDRLKSRAPE